MQLRLISSKLIPAKLLPAKLLPVGLGMTLAGLGLAASAQAQTSYNYSSFYGETSIDVAIPGATDTAVYGLNDAGQIAGSYFVPGTFDKDGNPITLDTTHGFFGTAAAQTTVDGPAAQASTDLPSAEINKINNSGAYAGDFEAVGLTGTESLMGFLGAGGSAAATGLSNSQALGVNNPGDSVGLVGSGDGTFNRSYVQSRTGTVSVFDVAGFGTSQANGINDSGVIVGNAAATATDSPNFGYVDTNGTFSFLSIPGAYDVLAKDINNTGTIVGGYTTTPGGAETGFIFSGGTLTSFLFPTATFTEIDAVSNTGEIAGTYFDANGGEHGFTALPVPEASTTVSLGLLLGLGGLLAAAKRKKAPAAA